jgi:hypothetical protein
MFGMWFHVQRLQQQEGSVADMSNTATVTAAAELPTEEQPTAESDDAVEAVELSRLSDFQDHARDIEPDPYYYLLDLARRNPAKWMDEHARRDVTWAHLFRNPDKYRGQLIFLRGRLRRLSQEDVGSNDYGFTARYEGWLYTDEGGQFPYAVIVSDPPTGMPLGLINEPVTVAGYFLGWYRYHNQEGKVHAAPILLGRHFCWITTPPLRPDASFGSTYGLAIGIAIVAIALAAIFLNRRKRTSPATDTSSQESEPLIFEEVQESDKPH